MDLQQIINILNEAGASCEDGFVCPFGLYGRNEKGNYGCFAQYPHGDPNEEKQKCMFCQIADYLEKFKAYESEE